MSAYHFQHKLALVTGAGSGIGRATAIRLGSLGCRVIISDRNANALAETATLLHSQSVENYSEVVDVADWQAMQVLADKVHQQYGVLDILVNNAGVATAGEFLHTPIEDWHWVMSINLMGVVHGCKAFGTEMAARGQGHIVNVASAAGYYAAPDMSAYSASKHAVMGLTESLRLELAEHNVGVSAICPGVINTNIVAAMRTHGEVVKSQAKLVDIYRKRNYGPEGVAEAVVSAVKHNRGVVPVSPEAWVLYAGKRLVPEVMDVVQRTALFRKLKP
ncbi:SDR family NAD(P)-dependent oxidoreductase [Agitococcus lubricus]|uniref:Short-subunit dehydrogenase n=1 Tax=Agitococcus lubricus TaxID=1077255 RepID=A0A2T5J478_9GAMM|nr:SDR family NAD(P)-dependent oxidoreductase [Agitococcus lubricus]PTQ91427.1 short-subunit dehydrogenase [Agitococcus lubricus]